VGAESPRYLYVVVGTATDRAAENQPAERPEQGGEGGPGALQRSGECLSSLRCPKSHCVAVFHDESANLPRDFLHDDRVPGREGLQESHLANSAQHAVGKSRHQSHICDGPSRVPSREDGGDGFQPGTEQFVLETLQTRLRERLALPPRERKYAAAASAPDRQQVGVTSSQPCRYYDVSRRSMELAMSAKEPYNYFLLLRALFRSIGGGSHDLLYQEFLPLLPNLLEGLNRLQSGLHKQHMKDLFVELCLTVPVRLSSLLPYLPMLMDPLVSALNGSHVLISQGLRTLELCVDNLQHDFLYEHIQPVRADLMQALWRTLRNNDQVAQVAFKCVLFSPTLCHL
jgi:hypothetical protein